MGDTAGVMPMGAEVAISMFGTVGGGAYPGGGAMFEFRVVLVLPSARGFSEGITLPSPLNLLASDLGKKRAAPTLADQFVDIGDQVHWQDHVGSFA